MGLFDKLFKKENCAFCGAEVGAMHRDKIKNKEYICGECAKKCSGYTRLSEMDKAEITEHMAFMARREQLYQQYMKKALGLPSSLTHYAVVLCDNIGMLGIRDKFNSKNKINHEVIRYDEIASYEYYKEMNKPTQEGGKETFKEDGVILHLIQPFGVNDDMVKKGLRVHPYIKQDIKLCFRTRENGANYADNVIQHLDGVFGKNSHSKPLFGMSVADKRELQANVDMAKLMGGMIKSAVKGEADPNDPDLQTKFAKAQESADDAKTGGMAIYSRRADEAENSVTG